jgi:aspartyl-tRNA(Asn)/glutamyl-tRNA(Gln) amidotransferase subunit A
LVKRDFTKAFEEVDVILTPVTPTPAFKIGEKVDDPLSMYLADIFTIATALAGLPAVSIPVTSDMGQVTRKENKNSSLLHVTGHSSPSASLPIGFQLIGKKWREADILGIGRYYEESNL